MSVRPLKDNLRHLLQELGTAQSYANQLVKRIDQHFVHNQSNFLAALRLLEAKNTRLTQKQIEQRNVKAAIIISHVLKCNLQSQNKDAMLTELEHMLFDSCLPFSTKKQLTQPLALLVAHHRKIQDYFLQLKIKQLIQSQSETQSHHMLSGWQKARDREQPCLFALMIMDSLLEYGQNCDIQYLLQIAELFVCFARLLAKIELNDYSRNIYAQWFKVCRRYFQQLAESIPQKNSKKIMVGQSIEALVPKLQLFRLFQSLIEYRGVQHERKEVETAYCPQCLERPSFSETKSILQLRNAYFELLLSSYYLAQSLELLSLISPPEQLAMLGWVCTGMSCFVNDSKLNQTQVNLVQLEMQYNLQSKLVQLYFLITKKIYADVQTLMDGSPELNQSLLFPSLQFTPYELHLFQHDASGFLELLDQFSRGGHMPSPKVRIGQLIRYMADLVPVFQAEFMVMCKYHLEKSTSCSITDFDENTLQSAQYRLSTEASLLMLTLFPSPIADDEYELDYLKAVFDLNHLVRFSDLALTLVLQLASLVAVDILTHKDQHFDAIDLGLNSKYQTVRVAALRCLLAFSKQKYYPRHIANILFLLQTKSQNQPATSYLLFWNILKTTISSHYKLIPTSILNQLVLFTKKTIIKHRLAQCAPKMTTHSWSCIQLGLLNSIEVCQLLAGKVGGPNSADFVWQVLLQIALLYQYFHSGQIKQAMLQLIREIGRTSIHRDRAFPFQLMTLLPHLLADLSHQQFYWDALAVIELLVLGIGRLARPKLWRKVYSIYLKLTTLFDSNTKSLQSQQNSNPLHTYSLMILLQRIVVYFGSEINQHLLYSLCLRCRKLIDSSASTLLQQRATTLIFSCSLYLREVTMFATMEEFILEQQISSVEKEMILSAIEMFLCCGRTVGGLAKYEYLVRMLYHFILQLQQFSTQNSAQQNIAVIKDSLCLKCRTQNDFQNEVLRVFKLFKLCKRSAYLYLFEIIHPQIEKVFYQKVTLSQAKDILMGHVATENRTDNQDLSHSEKLQLRKFNPFYSLEQLQPQNQFFVSYAFSGRGSDDEQEQKQNRRPIPIYSANHKRTKTS